MPRLTSARSVSAFPESLVAPSSSTTWYRAFIEQNLDAILLTTPDGCILAANLAACRLFGGTQEEICAAGRHGITDPTDPRIAALLDERARTGRMQGEATHRRLDGRRFEAEVWAMTFTAPDGSILASVSIRDITERHRAAAALRESEERHRLVIGSLDEGIVLQDRDGVIQMANASAGRILGLTTDQIMGRTSRDSRWRAIHEDGSPWPGDEHPAIVALRTGAIQRKAVMGVHRSDNDLVWISINAHPLVRAGEDCPYAVVSSFVDITAQIRRERRLRHTAMHDALTNLPNRVAFRARVQAAIERAGREPGYQFAVLYLDMDRFKRVNDQWGHHVGDRVLIEVADRLQRSTDRGDIIARWGGDEFVVLLDDIDNAYQAAEIAERLRSCCDGLTAIPDRTLAFTVSVGIAMSTHGYQQPDDYLHAADADMYRAKPSEEVSR